MLKRAKPVASHEWRVTSEQRDEVYYCVFCGGRLSPRRPRGRWACPACQAGFVQQRDPSGCVIGLMVEACGASPCCRSPRE